MIIINKPLISSIFKNCVKVITFGVIIKYALLNMHIRKENKLEVFLNKWLKYCFHEPYIIFLIYT